MEIDRRISIVQIVFVQIDPRTKCEVLNFGYIMGELITFQPNLKILKVPSKAPLTMVCILSRISPTVNYLQMQKKDSETCK